MNRICLFPGTFDPLTLGHVDIINRALPLFDRIIVGIGLNAEYCKKIGSKFILRGIRYVSDFEYEKTIADANRTLDRTIETIFLTGEPKYTSVASTIVRDIIRNGGDASPFLPDVISRSIPTV